MGPPPTHGIERAQGVDLYDCVWSGANSSDSEFMQYRSPVGVSYASSNRCPRCEPHVAHRISVRVMPRLLSVLSSTASGSTASKKLGQPDPESNFAPLLNSGV
jgi:hypothetical protein